MLLQDYVEDFLRFLAHEQRARATTLKGYGAQLRHFLHWLEANGYPSPAISDMTTPLLRRYLYHLSGKALRPRTVRSYFHPLRSLGEWLVENGALTSNVFKSVKMPTRDAAIRMTVSDEEVKTLLDACERQRNKRRAALCRAVIATLVYQALRRAELCDLQLEDIDLHDKTLLVRDGKGGKSRMIPLHEDCVAALKEWKALRWKDCKHSFLFALDRNRRMGFRGLHTLIEDVKAIAGYEGRENIKPHSLRHWRATDLMRAGVNIRDISIFLGHTRLETTAVYLHSDEEQIRGIANISRLNGAQEPSKPDNVQPTERGRFRRQDIRRKTLSRQ
jgi:site-specific recombinase XerD